MDDIGRTGRPNQRGRTRKDLLEAAARLMRAGRNPTLDEVAEEALVSRATAYRYFPGVDALLVEASLDVAFPDGAVLFENGPPDIAARVETAARAVSEMVRDNEPALRTMLANALQTRARDKDIPARQNRRSKLIEAALEPAPLTVPARDRLAKALAFFIGTEAMLVGKDVLQLDEAEAASVKNWAMRALVEAALAESRGSDNAQATNGDGAG
ncbi:MAG TPA: TetR/AcrR family transcriptional regulator [Allosphingosinicella sp.]|jgi:AcrR family transcriptional regulator|nr:TetR/AcrR family transcriptional regulator [Allosphingosinicella sp.]